MKERHTHTGVLGCGRGKGVFFGDVAEEGVSDWKSNSWLTFGTTFN